MKFTLGKKLALSASVALLIVGSSLTTLHYFESRNNIETGISQQISNTGKVFAANVSYWLTSKQMSMTSVVADASDDTLLAQLRQAKASGGFDNVFLARPDG